MSQSYSEIPPGGIVNIPPSIPGGMLYRVKSLAGISKQTLKLVPLSGQTQVSSGGKIIVALPATSLVDLSTFELISKESLNTAAMVHYGQPLRELLPIFQILLINVTSHEI